MASVNNIAMNKETKAVGVENKEGTEDRTEVAARSTVATPEQIVPNTPETSSR